MLIISATIMRHFITLTIVTILLGLLGCNEGKRKDFNEDTKKDFVFDEFRSQIESKGIKIDSVDKIGFVYISQGGLTLKVSIENLRRNYERDKDARCISEFVQTIVAYSIELPDTWADVQNSIYISLFPNNNDFKTFLHKRITDEFSQVYVHSGQDKLSWITKDDITKWGISERELEIQANKNADKLLKQTSIIFDTIENRKLGRFDVEDAALKGALLFAPGMKRKVKADLGFPLYAVIPVRDFCYIFSEKDFNFFSERVGKIVVDEYKHSGYPITTEILRFSDKGVEAVGKYSIDN